MDEVMLLRLSLLLALTVTSCPAAFRASANVVVLEETDSDEDGLGDDMEVSLGTDPEDPDTDHDGWDDLTELVHDTDPSDPADFPREPLDGGSESCRQTHPCGSRRWNCSPPGD